MITLPRELQCIIISHLPGKTIVYLQLTCRVLHRLVKYFCRQQAQINHHNTHITSENYLLYLCNVDMLSTIEVSYDGINQPLFTPISSTSATILDNDDGEDDHDRISIISLIDPVIVQEFYVRSLKRNAYNVRAITCINADDDNIRINIDYVCRWNHEIPDALSDECCTNFRSLLVTRVTFARVCGELNRHGYMMMRGSEIPYDNIISSDWKSNRCLWIFSRDRPCRW